MGHHSTAIVQFNRKGNSMNQDLIIGIAYFAICGVVCTLLIKGIIG